jgi:hypothetical protein
MHETQTRVVDEVTNSDGPTFAKLMTMAERELGAFISAVTELFGFEQVRLAAEDWLDELVLMKTLPGLTSRDWRSITIAASTRLANRVNASSHPIDIWRGQQWGFLVFETPAELNKKGTGDMFNRFAVFTTMLCAAVLSSTPNLKTRQFRNEKYRPRPRCLGGWFGLEGRLRQPYQGWLQRPHHPRAGGVL